MCLAIMEQVRKHAFDALQALYPEPGLGKSLRSDMADTFAISPVFEFEQGGDFLQAEPEVLRAPDKTNALDMTEAIAAISTNPVSRLLNQLAPFVIANSLYPDARGLGQITNSKICFLHNKAP